jgi:N6-L-threonylcarbamoyladenine synthase
MITLGIETSCDETALALLETREVQGGFKYRVIGSLIHSQAELHSAYGGVFPTLAKREHGRNLLPLLKKLLADAAPLLGKEKSVLSLEELEKRMTEVRLKFGAKNADLLGSFTDIEFLRSIPNIDRIAVTEGPGLEPALWVGISFAEILGELWSVNNIVDNGCQTSVIPINHMEGHILGSLMEEKIENGKWNSLKKLDLPAIALLISGGHTELVKIESVDSTNTFPLKYSIIGQTKDDAVGEAFDKVARLLSLPYPGGPHVSSLAKEAVEQGVVSSIKLPRPMLGSGDLNFSFSGLKTAVLYAVRKEEKEKSTLSDNFKKGLAREFEESVNDTLVAKFKKAIEFTQAKTVIVGGGVIANTKLRNTFENLAKEYGLPIYLPSKHVSGDNALMIALAGSFDENKTGRKLKADGTKRLNAEVPPQ